jgi:hypothetical protein
VVTVLLAALALALWPPMFMQAGHEKPVPFSTAGWKTNFAKHSVPLEEIISGGPPKDGIPAIDVPKFDTVAAGVRWLKAREHVVLFQSGSEARAYPLQILIWHEIVNDTVAGQPVAITFCPLCNTAIAFDRRLAGRVLDFGTTGKLRFSDLVMYDRQTESWWQQVTGEAIVGDLTGRQLTFLPAQIVSWDTFRWVTQATWGANPCTCSASRRNRPSGMSTGNAAFTWPVALKRASSQRCIPSQSA